MFDCADCLVRLACFVSVLFDIDGYEGICGRFGRFGDDRFAYRPGRVPVRVPDDPGVSFTVLVGLSSDDLARTGTDLDASSDRCAKVRRQG